MSVISTLIVVPTYNERENLPALAARLRETVPHAHLLVVDDNSPDGTGQIADLLAAEDRRIFVLHRSRKDGLGRAYVAGFLWGLARGYERLVQMDADFSHDPAAVPHLLATLENAEVALGSRYVPGGGTANWNGVRRLMSRGGNFYARRVLGLHQHDLSGGFKAWRRGVLEDIDLPTIRSNGYSFQIEMTWRAVCCGKTIQEIPIVFSERREGTSKMNRRIMWEALTIVWRLRSSDPIVPTAKVSCSKDESAFG